MSDITKKGSKDDLMERIRAAVSQHKPESASTQREIPRTAALLFDVSGSMALMVSLSDPRRRRRIDELRTLAQQFSADVRRFQFSCTCDELEKDEEISEPIAGTGMHTAFQTLKTSGITHVVMITDGIPDSEDMAIRYSQGLKIDVLYVGPDPAPPFLRKLAAETGGQYGGFSLSDQKAITTKIKGLLQ